MNKVYIKTFGCSANQSDSEIMAGLLEEAGYKLVDSVKKADLVIINSCGVKNRSEFAFFGEIEAAKKLKKKIIAAGCIPSGNRKILETRLKGISVIDVNSIKEIAEVAKRTLNGERIVLFGIGKVQKICLPRQRRNKVIAIVPISEGCLGKCSYCFTKLAKGNLFSYPEEAILQEIRDSLKEGCKEIWLTSQDCACYGLDRKTSLANLLDKVCKIPGKFYIRVGMGNPENILKILPELIRAYKNPKVFKFLHIPVQSGNNRVLKLMNRAYGIAQFKAIIARFRKQIRDLTISTDVICGFPTETEKEFKDTLNLITWLKPDVVNISQFWARQGTPAAKMKQVDGKVKQTRSKELTGLCKEITLIKNKLWIGKKCEVLVDEIGKKGGFVSRNKHYKPVILKEKLKLGSFLRCEIADAAEKYLIGKISKN
ncbi:MAG: tRNA (N(6)-L-threonylcarbamoyladenosine(37)-C(2))-methylthiotransferase [DPANN group archaeon]|nr:tRNA (N(6)-L-threonylcarbamoyladenosine(37)-C(2))-methylthiotransferase [DPANN group archaeon]